MNETDHTSFFQTLSRDENVQRAAASVVVALVVAAARRALFSQSAG
jgi:hypothetical protein